MFGHFFTNTKNLPSEQTGPFRPSGENKARSPLALTVEGDRRGATISIDPLLAQPASTFPFFCLFRVSRFLYHRFVRGKETKQIVRSSAPSIHYRRLLRTKEILI